MMTWNVSIYLETDEYEKWDLHERLPGFLYLCRSFQLAVGMPYAKLPSMQE